LPTPFPPIPSLISIFYFIFYFYFFLIQALWCFSNCLVTSIINSTPLDAQPLLNWVDGLGFFLWALGFAIEVLSDYQKTSVRHLCLAKSSHFTTVTHIFIIVHATPISSKKTLPIEAVLFKLACGASLDTQTILGR
jgi:hypothetical protein